MPDEAAPARALAEVTRSGRWLTPGVATVAVASFVSDATHKVVTSLMPGFLTSRLRSGPAALGAIESFSDALAGSAKLADGPLGVVT